jgi:hypothetical protein
MRKIIHQSENPPPPIETYTKGVPNIENKILTQLEIKRLETVRRKEEADAFRKKLHMFNIGK